MDGPGSRGDSRFSLGGYGMSMLSGDTAADMYGNPGVSLGAGRPGTSLQQMSPRGHGSLGGGCAPRGMKGSPADMCYEVPTSQGLGGGLDSCGVPDVTDDSYGGLQAKKSPPSNGKKTKGRVKIKMEYIENKLRRYTTFSKRKTGIMKKAYELSTLTGTQVMLLVASETGHVYTFATRKLQPMITSEAGKALIQTCLNSPDPPASSSGAGGDQRMSATGFEETELTYNISDEDSKDDEMSVAESSGDSSGCESPPHDSEQPSNVPPPPPMPPPKLSNNPSSSSPPPSGPDAKRMAGGQNIVMRPQGGGSALNQQLAAAAASLQAQSSNLVGPLLYQMPQGVLCSSSTNGVIFSLAQAPNSTSGGDQQPQFITIPLSMAMAASNGHSAELDLSAKHATQNSIMGCNGSKSVTAVITEGPGGKDLKNGDVTTDSATRTVTPQPIPPSMAFDIPFVDEDTPSTDGSIVKKHPPKRLQRLEEQQQNVAPASLEELQEKQQEAESRRVQYLQLRAQSAKRKYAMRNNNNGDEQDEEGKNCAEDDKEVVTNKEVEVK